MARQKQVLLFQGAAPTVSDLGWHAAALEVLPIDGVVFDVVTDSGVNLSRDGWGLPAVKADDLLMAMELAHKVRFSRPLATFVRLAMQSGGINLFSDSAWDAALQNVSLLTQVASAAGATGVLLDVEEHPGYSSTFNYAHQVRATASWEKWREQAQLRGAQLLRAIEWLLPAPKVLAVFGYHVPWVYSNEGKIPLADTDYGLLIPFLDGLVRGAQAARVIDGAELTYTYRTAAQFRAAYRAVKRQVPRLVADRRRFAKVVSVALPVWLDADWWGFSWNSHDLFQNYYSPRQFEETTRAALAQADEFVWIYSARVRWLPGAAGQPVTVPAEYLNALRRARGR